MDKIIILQDGDILKEVELDRQQIVIGRDEKNVICLNDISVSRRHALLTCALDEYFIEDLGSTNGTLLNDRPISKHMLKNGDELRIGEYVLSFERTVPQLIMEDDPEKTQVISMAPRHQSYQSGSSEFARPSSRSGSSEFARPSSRSGSSEFARPSSRSGSSEFAKPSSRSQSSEFARPSSRPESSPFARPSSQQASSAYSRQSSQPASSSFTRPSSQPASSSFSRPSSQPSSSSFSRPTSPPTPRNATFDTPIVPKTATVKYFRGPKKGASEEINRSLYTLGKPGGDVAVIARRSQGYYLMKIGNSSVPIINDKRVDVGGGIKLNDGDKVEVGENAVEISFAS